MSLVASCFRQLGAVPEDCRKQCSDRADLIRYILQGEPFIVNIGWAMLAASFSFSLAAVVWGRSGM